MAVPNPSHCHYGNDAQPPGFSTISQLLPDFREHLMLILPQYREKMANCLRQRQMRTAACAKHRSKTRTQQESNAECLYLLTFAPASLYAPHLSPVTANTGWSFFPCTGKQQQRLIESSLLIILTSDHSSHNRPKRG